MLLPAWENQLGRMLDIAVTMVWGQQGPRSPVLKPEPEALSASCP